MPITELLERNAREFPKDIALVEINPDIQEKRRVTWRDYELIQPDARHHYRRDITWHVFNEKANRVANLLISRGIRKGDKVAILMMNCLEWLPIYFGILKTGALAVPMNFRFDAQEIKYCLELSETDVLIFGPEFVGRIEEIVDEIDEKRILFYVGGDCPTFAEDYDKLASNCSSLSPEIEIKDSDDAAIYFSSGTTGFPKAILHNHESLMHAAKAEQNHHGQTKDDVFLCIPPLYHTGAKMHWFGSLLTGGKAVLLKGVTPKTILETVSNEGCTIVWLLVPWAQDILLALDRGEIKLEDYKLDQWRLMHIGAQPVPQSLIKRWKEYFPHHQYDTNYGLSESIGPGCVHLGVENINKVGAIGIPGYGWEAKIVDPEGNPVEQGSVGIYGDHVAYGRLFCHFVGFGMIVKYRTDSTTAEFVAGLGGYTVHLFRKADLFKITSADCKSTVVGHAVNLAGDLMYSGMSTGIRGDRGLYRNAGIGTPLRPYSVLRDL